MKKKQIDEFDINVIKNKVRDIKKQIDGKQQALDDIDKQIEKLENSKEGVNKKLSNTIYKELEKLETNFGVVKAKLNMLNTVSERAERTEYELLELYKKSFKRLSNERITISKSDFKVTEYQRYRYSYELTDNFSYLSLYQKGFGYCYNSDSPSRYIGDSISDIRLLKRIFGCSAVADYINKTDKLEIFNAFSEAFSNFIIITKTEDEEEKEKRKQHVVFKTKNIPYVDVEKDYEENIEDITTKTVNSITFNFSKLSFDFEDEAYDVSVDNLDFGHLFAISFIWERLEKDIDSIISRYESITENNTLVLEKLKRKVGHMVVVDEL